MLAQTRAVDPADLEVFVTVEKTAGESFPQAMVLVPINGVYRRRITLEKLELLELDGFNWQRPGEDIRFDSTLSRVGVENFRHRMGFCPQRAGRLTIPAFVHHGFLRPPQHGTKALLARHLAAAQGDGA